MNNQIFQLFLRGISNLLIFRKQFFQIILKIIDNARLYFFWTTIDNESELLQKFGIEVLPFDMADFLRDVHWSFDVQKPFLIRYHHLESGCEVEE